MPAVLFVNTIVHYRKKIWNIFLFQRFCAILWSAQPVSELEKHTYEQILPLGELISTEQQNEGQRFKNNYFDIFRN